jgi:hypothetical protein
MPSAYFVREKGDFFDETAACVPTYPRPVIASRGGFRSL